MNRNADTENRLADTGRKERCGMSWESSADMYPLACVNRQPVGSCCSTPGAELRALCGPGGLGWEVGKEGQRGGDIGVQTADSRCSAAETNTLLQSYHPPTTKILKRKNEWDDSPPPPRLSHINSPGLNFAHNRRATVFDLQGI